jgi:hypothetical protein
VALQKDLKKDLRKPSIDQQAQDDGVGFVVLWCLGGWINKGWQS